VTVKVTVHEKMTEVRPNGASDLHLRQNLWLRSLKICQQSSINEPISGGMIGFGFKLPYKLQVVVQQETLGIFSIQLLSSQMPMDPKFFAAFKQTLAFVDFPKTS